MPVCAVAGHEKHLELARSLAPASVRRVVRKGNANAAFLCARSVQRLPRLPSFPLRAESPGGSQIQTISS